ncbi:MAG: hypothetical protein DMG32_19715 [Acidobacteria bacterium]|nr:MAG: hypothetical protein DMG32_19715 [Acidobacteriota bacterium]
MKMRTAHVMRRPFRQDHIRAGLRRIAAQHGIDRPVRLRDPLELAGQLIGDRRGIEIGRVAIGLGRSREYRAEDKTQYEDGGDHRAHQRHEAIAPSEWSPQTSPKI